MKFSTMLRMLILLVGILFGGMPFYGLSQPIFREGYDVFPAGEVMMATLREQKVKSIRIEDVDVFDSPPMDLYVEFYPDGKLKMEVWSQGSAKAGMHVDSVFYEPDGFSYTERVYSSDEGGQGETGPLELQSCRKLTRTPGRIQTTEGCAEPQLTESILDSIAMHGDTAYHFESYPNMIYAGPEDIFSVTVSWPDPAKSPHCTRTRMFQYEHNAQWHDMYSRENEYVVLTPGGRIKEKGRETMPGVPVKEYIHQFTWLAKGEGEKFIQADDFSRNQRLAFSWKGNRLSKIRFYHMEDGQLIGWLVCNKQSLPVKEYRMNLEDKIVLYRKFSYTYHP